MRKLATAAFSFSAAIFISRYLLPYDWLLLTGAAAAILSLSGLFFRGNLRVRLLIALLFLSAGFLWSWAYTAIYVAPAGRLHVETADVSAVVSEYPSASARGYRVGCAILMDSGPRIGARIYYSREIDLKPGDIIEFSARFLRTDGTDDSERIDALSSNGAFLAGYVSGEIRIKGAENPLRSFPKRLARTIADMIDRLYSNDVSPFMKALLVGERDELNSDASLTAALSASGISHVVAISGMHVSFLMGFLAAFVKNKRVFAFYGLPVLFLFMAMTGFTPSVTRAGIMQLFLICAPLFRRESDSLTSLSAALFVLLAVNPYSCASTGLQLSFAATLGIILFTSKIDAAFTDSLHENRRYKNKILKAILCFAAASLATTIGALVFTLPLTAIHFGIVSLIAPVTNLLTLWAVSLTFTFGLISFALGFIYFPLGAAIARIVSYAANYITNIARAFAGIPYSAVYTSNISMIFWLSYVYIMFVTLPLARARLRQYLIPCCLVIITLCGILLVSPLIPISSESSITALDVGQGQSIILASGDNTAIVDCGSASGENAGAIASEYLSNSGCVSVSLLILTHFHADHVNGVEYLLSRIDVSALVIPDPEDSFLAEGIIELATRLGTDIIYVTETLSVSLGDLDLIVYPPLGSDDENERGLAILCMGDISALITGDMPAALERRLLRFAYLPCIDVLIVGHHGSRFSSSEELLAALSPKIAIISVGANNYGHPSDDTIRRLERFSITVFRTDQAGHVKIGGRAR